MLAFTQSKQINIYNEERLTIIMKCLTYNIQAGVGTKKYVDYVLKAHQQLVSTRAKRQTISRIATLISDYDVVLLQEVDLGGRRNSFENQAQQLQEKSGLTYLVSQTNRVIGNVSMHGNIILSKTPLSLVANEKLPGKTEAKITGRGIVVASSVINNVEYHFANTHFSLGKHEQDLQFKFVAKLLAQFDNVILTGDFNCSPKNLCYQNFIAESGLTAMTNETHMGFPSWKPSKALDHVFISPNLLDFKCRTIKSVLSDHLPIELIDDAVSAD